MSLKVENEESNRFLIKKNVYMTQTQNFHNKNILLNEKNIKQEIENFNYNRQLRPNTGVNPTRATRKMREMTAKSQLLTPDDKIIKTKKYISSSSKKRSIVNNSVDINKM